MQKLSWTIAKWRLYVALPTIPTIHLSLLRIFNITAPPFYLIFLSECSVNHCDIALICTLYLWYSPTLWSEIFLWMIMIIFYFKFMSKVILYIWFCPLNWPTQTTLSQKYLEAGEIFLPNRIENKQTVRRPENAIK